MQNIAVKSRIIVGLQYDYSDQKLAIQFRNGEHRRFRGVPGSIVSEMVAASSPGEYYIQNVRTRFERVSM